MSTMPSEAKDCVECGISPEHAKAEDFAVKPCPDCKRPICEACAFSGPAGDLCPSCGEKRNAATIAG